MAHDIFISYSSKDKPIADAVCASLEASGVRCWIAPRDIAAGEDWPTAIARAIASSRIMVLIFTAHSNASEDVGRELILAANNKLVIIPFRIDNVEAEPGKQYYLARTHWLDAVNPPTREQVALLIERVKTILPATDPKPKAEVVQTVPVPEAAKKLTPKVVRRKKSWLWIPLAGIGVLLVSLCAWLFLLGGWTWITSLINLPGSSTTPVSSSTDFFADFNDPSHQGGYDPSDWYMDPGISLTSIQQVEGAMLFSKDQPGEELGALRTNRSWTLGEVDFLQARLKLSSEYSGDDGSVAVKLADSGTWWAGCVIKVPKDATKPHLWCGQWTSTSQPPFFGLSEEEEISLEYDRWYTLRIEYIPESSEFQTSLDNDDVHSWSPANMAEILGKELFVSIGTWTGENTLLTGSVDDVYLKTRK